VRNICIFQVLAPSIYFFVSKILVDLQEWKKEPVSKRNKIYNIPSFAIDVIYGFFDGAQQEGKCGASMFIRLKESHVIISKMGVGDGTNTFTELLALWGLLRFTKKRGLLQPSI